MSKITQYRIVIPQQAQTNEFRAAAFVRENVKLVCGKKLDIVRDTEPATELEIVVGKTNRESLDGLSFPRSRDGIWEYKMVKRVAGCIWPVWASRPRRRSPLPTPTASWTTARWVR